jgi:hypothetical protein
MLRRRGTIRWAAALILALALARPAAAEEAGEGLGRFWAEARSWIAAVLPWAMADTTSDHGPGIDPNGATSESDRGSHIDPDGATSESDRGSIIDPNG